MKHHLWRNHGIESDGNYGSDVESRMRGDVDGRQDEGSGSLDGTTSGSELDTALWLEKLVSCQHEGPSCAQKQNTTHEPPIQPEEHLYWVIGCRQ